MPQNAQERAPGLKGWLARRGVWTRRALAMLFGAIATLAHAPFQLTLLYALAIVGLVWLLDTAPDDRRLMRAFANGWFFAFGHLLSGMHWIVFAFEADSASWGLLWGVPATIGLTGGLALFWGAGCVLAKAMWTKDWRRLAGLTFALAVTEWLRGHMFGGLPWLLPGYVWTPGEPISQLASLVGIYGLSALTLMAAAAPAAVLDAPGQGVRRFAPLLVTALCLGLAWGWGARRIASAPISLPGSAPIIRVVDSGLSQEEKWSVGESEVFARYIQASGDPRESHASVVIWPEGALPSVNTLDIPEVLDAIGQSMGDRVLILGYTRCEPKPECEAYIEGQRSADGLHFFNSAAVVDGVSGRARISQTYDKHRLVPFGEFIPLWSLVSKLNITPLQRIGAGFDAGPPPTRLVVPDAPQAIVLICYEAIFPGAIPHGEERPGWLVSVTNDAWFGRGVGPWQHMTMARYRAIEEGLPLARAASGGVSAIVDSFGRAPRWTADRGVSYVEGQLPPALDEPSYVRWGFVLTPFLILLFAAIRFAPVSVRARGIEL